MLYLINSEEMGFLQCEILLLLLILNEKEMLLVKLSIEYYVTLCQESHTCNIQSYYRSMN